VSHITGLSGDDVVTMVTIKLANVGDDRDDLVTIRKAEIVTG
jgi:hypothetical protein